LPAARRRRLRPANTSPAPRKTKNPTASRLSELLNFAGLPPTLLTPRARLLSAVAARVADALGAASPTPNAALACWAELALRESRAVALKASTDARAAEMRAEAAAVEARSAALAESLRSVREQQHRQGKRRAELEARSVQEMAAKRAEYGRAVARCERKVGAALVAAAGGAAGGAGGGQAEQQPQLLRHALLQQRAERLAAKREQLREAERRAAEFMDLPASVAGARAALEQARERLARSQERLELGLAQL
jgi:Skp family chaperone for outer membrane proteins